MTQISFDRRGFTLAALAAAAALQLPRRAQAAPQDPLRHVVDDPTPQRRRVSGLRARDWREHVTSLRGDAILCDTVDRVLARTASTASIRPRCR
jgi:L,D-transpeptidase ErfK/SrfK